MSHALLPDRATFQIAQWWPTVVFRCLCTPEDPQVLTVLGTQAEAVCPVCQRAYRIEHFEYDRPADSITIALGERTAVVPVIS